MPLIKASDPRAMIVRRRTNRKANPFITVEDGDIGDFGSDAMSTMYSDAGSETNGDYTDAGSSHWSVDLGQQRMKVFDEMATRTLLAETDLVLKRFEAAEDVPFNRTYQRGTPVREFAYHVVKPRIGIVLLSGYDL
jgi:hypothetical protein